MAEVARKNTCGNRKQLRRRNRELAHIRADVDLPSSARSPAGRRLLTIRYEVTENTGQEISASQRQWIEPRAPKAFGSCLSVHDDSWEAFKESRAIVFWRQKRDIQLDRLPANMLRQLVIFAIAARDPETAVQSWKAAQRNWRCFLMGQSSFQRLQPYSPWLVQHPIDFAPTMEALENDNGLIHLDQVPRTPKDCFLVTLYIDLE